MAFPNGDYSERDLLLLKEADYTCSLITEPGFNYSKTNIFKLKRIGLNKNPSKSELIAWVSGIRTYAFNFKTIFNKGKRRNNLKENIS